MEKEQPLVVKIIFEGNSGVGKTSLVYRETQNVFGKLNNTIGIDFKVKTYPMNDSFVKAQLWDTAGAERHKLMKKLYYNKSHSLCLCFDLSNKESFIELSKHLDLLKEICYPGTVYFIGCKSDLNHEVTNEEILQLAQKQKIKYYETSAKDNTGVNSAFKQIVLATAQNQLIKLAENKNNESNPIKSLKTQNQPNSHCICYC